MSSYSSSSILLGGFNPSEKYWSTWESSPNRGENKKSLNPPNLVLTTWMLRFGTKNATPGFDFLLTKNVRKCQSPNFGKPMKIVIEREHPTAGTVVFFKDQSPIAN